MLVKLLVNLRAIYINSFDRDIRENSREDNYLCIINSLYIITIIYNNYLYIINKLEN